MIINKYTTLAELYVYIDLFGVDVSSLLDRLKDYPIRKEYDISFNTLKLKQLIDLQENIESFDDLLFIPFKTILGIEREALSNTSAFDCLRFALYAKSELERISNLFKEIEYKPTSEEQRAGIGKLSHGWMGTIDWYARRMGIHDHDQVAELNWVRIYKCLKIDHDNNSFERRYRQVVNQQSKIRK